MTVLTQKNKGSLARVGAQMKSTKLMSCVTVFGKRLYTDARVCVCVCVWVLACVCECGCRVRACVQPEGMRDKTKKKEVKLACIWEW
jgi:hypothetical protein